MKAAFVRIRSMIANILDPTMLGREDATALIGKTHPLFANGAFADPGALR
jgi:hypothetical protein